MRRRSCYDRQQVKNPLAQEILKGELPEGSGIRIDFNGDTISLKGRGHITAQKTVDLQFYTQVGRDELQVPIFRPILGEASRQFMLIEVTGTLEDPIVNKQAFPRLNERLQQLFPELAREMQTVEPPAPTSPTPLLPWRR